LKISLETSRRFKLKLNLFTTTDVLFDWAQHWSESVIAAIKSTIVARVFIKKVFRHPLAFVSVAYQNKPLQSKKHLQMEVLFSLLVDPLGLEPRLFCTKNRRVASYTMGQFRRQK
jgi:hypothetical protein